MTTRPISRHRVILIACACVLLAALGSSARSQQVPTPQTATPSDAFPRYELTRLQPLPGDKASHANGINESGVVTGNSWDRFMRFPRPVVWTRNGKPKHLGSLGGSHGEAFAINDSGQIVGWSGTADSQRRGFVWTKGVMERLEPLPGGSYCDAIDINSHGQVIGISGFSPDGGKTEFTRAAIWVKGVAVDLGTLGGEDSWPAAINDAGDVVGNSPDGAAWRGFLWRKGRMEPLPPLPGFTTSNATDIDAAGKVIGESSYRSATHGRVAVLTRWVEGVPEQLPLPYDGWSIQAITNGTGVVVATIGGWEYATGPVYIFSSGGSRLLDKRLIGRPRYLRGSMAGVQSSAGAGRRTA